MLATAPPAIVSWLQADEKSLAAAITAWNGVGATPSKVTLLAIDRQRLLRRVALSKKTSAAVLAASPGEIDDVKAEQDLLKLHQSTPPQKGALELRPAPAASKLLSWYQEAQSRFGIKWTVLAAINFVESAFCRVKNDSGAGAQGPMQFEPETWKLFGLGGDVQSPHDSILGAANYLAASGGVTDVRTALRHYNQSALYVDAVMHYAHRMAHVPSAFFEYYAR